MLARVIENWLTNTNEINFQIAFCQALMKQGHTILYSAKHRSMEQGKDIISVDADGNYCAYQLKGGNINPSQFRDIRGELDELIQLPPVHPSIDRSKPWQSFLVTNGRLSDEVRFQITQLNEANVLLKRNFSNLDVIERDRLLEMILAAQNSFLPQEFNEEKGLHEFQLFLEILLADGKDMLPKEKLFNFLNGTFYKELSGRPIHPKYVVLSAPVLVSLLLNKYQNADNHFAMVEAWVITAGMILSFAVKKGLKDKDWKESFNLIFDEIEYRLECLKEEFLTRPNLLEGNSLGDGGQVYRARATLLMGTLAAYELNKIDADEHYQVEQQFLERCKFYIDSRKLTILGESTFAYLYNLIRLLEKAGDTDTASLVTREYLETVVQVNGRSSQSNGLPNPYYSLDVVLEASLVGNEELAELDFRRSSYTLLPVLLMLAKRGQRAVVADNWRNISHIFFNEFIPEHPEDAFLFRADSGVNQSLKPKPEQSWAELQAWAVSSQDIPELYTQNLKFLRFMTLVYPYRINSTIFRCLESK